MLSVTMRDIMKYNAGLPYHALKLGVGTEEYYARLEEELPCYVSRVEAERATGGLITPRMLCRDDAQNKGPSEKVRDGSLVGYPREAFLVYLRRKLASLKASDTPKAR